MKRLVCVVLLTASMALAQNPGGNGAYQPIRVKFRVLDLDGRPLEGATIAARLDSASSRLPPDRVLKAKSGADEFTYTLGEQAGSIFSTQQQVGPEGFCEVPFIVYSNRNDAIDYELGGLYKEPNHEVLVSADIHKSLTNGDDNGLITLHTNVRRQLAPSSILIALAAWIGATMMGFLLFFRGFYRRWLASGRSVDSSRALCWSGTMFISLFTACAVWWWLLPRFFAIWVFCGVLFVILIIHMLVSVSTQRRTAY